MVVVAIAGGTGNVGRFLVDAIVATGKHDVKVLSRKADPALAAEIGAPIVAVDYTDVDALAKVLEDNKVHTVVSAIAMHSEVISGTPPGEINLIHAADQSSTTKRIISSGWAVPADDILAGDLKSANQRNRAREELGKAKSLEYTVFNAGYFMDYWGIPAIPSYHSRMPTYFWIDMANNAAALPGSGNDPGVFTHCSDVARFVAASLDLPKWDPETNVYGDRLTWNEFLALAEDAKGTKFSVVYDSVEKLKTGQTTELPAQVPLYKFWPKEFMNAMAATFGLWFEQGAFDLKGVKFLNEQLPEIKPMTVKEMLDKAWRK
ncbi:hypothetical protein MAPG_03806 [Magnaporthiopsis poae ATCC 64411]|uniref:NAD(P)-binding domain-containing protein n=1 Tax=Magnaporthiopsis poae (strain ATCC 64411 / 73-15) TaxID=644358 RepID=A0A0C4DV07_MAGP6|nr:hypothetical protein MAPG_03806 [Magnaporthiopsis poae ATCC 64411]